MGFDIDAFIGTLLSVKDAKAPKRANLKEGDVRALLTSAREVLMSQSMLLEVAAPVKIVGDIHGQYTDLLRIFESCGYPPHTQYLFLGDYVDRGRYSAECICLLLAYKVKYPDKMWLLRGNHECAPITRIYGFYDEIKRLFNLKLWKCFMDVFNCLPVAAVVDGSMFCVHAGLSPSTTPGDVGLLEEIRNLPRPTDIPDQGLLCDLMWADPSADVRGWAECCGRGVSYEFGADIVEGFLEAHGFDIIVRAHQVTEAGYEFKFGRKLVTLFSAPNYTGEFDNDGAVMCVDESLLCSFQVMKAKA